MRGDPFGDYGFEVIVQWMSDRLVRSDGGPRDGCRVWMGPQGDGGSGSARGWRLQDLRVRETEIALLFGMSGSLGLGGVFGYRRSHRGGRTGGAAERENSGAAVPESPWRSSRGCRRESGVARGVVDAMAAMSGQVARWDDGSRHSHLRDAGPRTPAWLSDRDAAGRGTTSPANTGMAEAIRRRRGVGPPYMSGCWVRLKVQTPRMPGVGGTRRPLCTGMSDRSLSAGCRG